MGVKELEAVHLVDSAPAGANVFLTLDKADLLKAKGDPEGRRYALQRICSIRIERPEEFLATL
jgi:hypothetical protein